MTIPFIDFGGTGEELVFLHANGYPPDCYRPLLMRLAEKYHVTAMMQRPLWPDSNPQDIDDWLPLTDDILQFLDERQARCDYGSHRPSAQRKGIFCVGHSMGGVALLRAALREPERFSSIVLLEPVLFLPYFMMLWRLLFKSGLGYRFHPLVANARQRRGQFDDLDRLFNGYRRKPIFRYMDDNSLRSFVEGITCPMDGGGYQLCYSAEWEMRIYITGVWHDMDLWHGLPDLQAPTLIVRGAETDTFWERTAKLVKRKQLQIKVETLEKSTHLVPLERPQEVSNLIQFFFEENVPQVFL
jgi:pimeloyl-ACP methyl ester carboxylesterase